MTYTYEEQESPSPFIETIWRARSERTGFFMSVAAAHSELVITRAQGRAIFTVRGPETHATPLHYPNADVEWIGIRFRLGTFMPHLPPAQLRDRQDANLPEANQRAFWLHGAAWAFPTYENADTFVARLIREGLLVHDPLVNAVLRGEHSASSQRYIQKHFLRATGLTYSTIRQIERARRAKALLERGVSILDTAYESGYFDQSHLTNSLKRFLGQTPAQLIR